MEPQMLTLYFNPYLHFYQVIGDNNLIMGSCHIAHDCKIGNNNIFANNTLLAGHVVIEVSYKLFFSQTLSNFSSSSILSLDCNVHPEVNEALQMQDYVHTAGAIVIHQFCHVGSFAFIGGGSAVCHFPEIIKFLSSLFLLLFSHKMLYMALPSKHENRAMKYELFPIFYMSLK